MDMTDSLLQAELARRVAQLQAELAQLTSYADALNERCIQDTAAIGRLRSWISDALLVLQSIDSDGECHTSLAAIRGLSQQGVAVLNGNDNQTPNTHSPNPASST